MADDLVFYTNPMSRGRIARWMLEEVGAPYETRLIAWGSPAQRDLARDVNPMAKVPTIVHGGKVVTEAAAICLYLADAFPQAGLAPAPAERADYYRWVLFASGPVEQAVTAKSMGWTVPDDPQRRGMVGFGSHQRTMDALETAIAGREWICGDRFSAADVYVGSQVNWGLAFGTIPETPALAAYAQRLQARPAARRAWMMDEALMKPEARAATGGASEGGTSGGAA